MPAAMAKKPGEVRKSVENNDGKAKPKVSQRGVVKSKPRLSLNIGLSELSKTANFMVHAKIKMLVSAKAAFSTTAFLLSE
jgi:hypothetical protein